MTASPDEGAPTAPGFLPGSPGAVARGCRCSRLANASYRVGADAEPLLDPDCMLHRRDAGDVDADAPERPLEMRSGADRRAASGPR